MSKRKRKLKDHGRDKRWFWNLKPGQTLTITFNGKKRGTVMILSPPGTSLDVDKAERTVKNTN